jgi:hypothetical protein
MESSNGRRPSRSINAQGMKEATKNPGSCQFYQGQDNQLALQVCKKPAMSADM